MRARPGFTLLEAAVAMTIVGVITVGAMGAFGADLRAADRARQLLPASSLATERMAALDLVDPLTLRALPDSLSRGTFDGSLSAYAWTAAAREVRGEAGLMELTVRVTWTEGDVRLVQRRYRPMPTLVAGPR